MIHLENSGPPQVEFAGRGGSESFSGGLADMSMSLRSHAPHSGSAAVSLEGVDLAVRGSQRSWNGLDEVTVDTGVEDGCVWTMGCKVGSILFAGSDAPRTEVHRCQILQSIPNPILSLGSSAIGASPERLAIGASTGADRAPRGAPRHAVLGRPGGRRSGHPSSGGGKKCFPGMEGTWKHRAFWMLQMEKGHE